MSLYAAIAGRNMKIYPSGTADNEIMIMTITRNFAITAAVTAVIVLFGSSCANSSASNAANEKPAAKADSHADHAQQPEQKGDFKIPSSLTEEHAKLHEDLAALVKAGGETAKAAELVEQRLSVHFKNEEQFAMPQLGLLATLSRGPATENMRPMIALTDKLKADMPQMLEEHKGIVEALDALAAAGKKENKPAAVEFSEMLKHHAVNEEQILYPAAIVVGEYLKLALKEK